MPRSLALEPDIRIGALLIAPSTCEVEWHGDRTTLEPQVMRVLLLFAQNAGKVISRDQLMNECWDGRAVSEDALNRVVAQTRRLARLCGAFEIATVRKVGYRLTPLDSATTASSRESSHLAQVPIALSSLLRSARARLSGAVLALGVLMIAAMWFGMGRTAPAAAGYAVQVISVSADDGSTSSVAADLTARISHTLSRLRGVWLVDGRSARTRPDFTLSVMVDEKTAHRAIRLALTDEKSHGRIWSASFEPTGPYAPDPSDRAVAAAAKIMSLTLGRTSIAKAAAEEPPDPEVVGLVERARRRLALAHDARHNRDWSRFTDLIEEVDRSASQALARAPDSSDALMLKYEVNALPQYPFEGENERQYRTRQGRAETYLARAVAADPNNPNAIVAAGRDLMVRQRWDESESLLARAVAIDPNSGDGNLWYAFYLSLMNRCSEGLKHAQIAVSLTPDDVWRRLAVPRLLHCSGRHEEAAHLYLDILDQNRGNVFILREIYLMRLAQARSSDLRDLREHILVDLWTNAPPPDVAAMLRRIEQAADALDGRPADYVAALDADLAAIRILAEHGYTGAHDPTMNRGGFIGKDVGDSLFALSVEYAMARQDDQAIQCLQEAIERSSLYLPWALPHGATPFPAHLTSRKDYKALWKSRPELADLVKRRKRATPWPERFWSRGDPRMK